MRLPTEHFLKPVRAGWFFSTGLSDAMILDRTMQAMKYL
jgi:hypothetical protein